VAAEDELIAGRYRLVSRLGSGAMGVVWQGQDERLHRTVAIKQLLLSSGMSDPEADEANRRAMREGRITARMQHPNAVAVYDVVEHNGRPCLIMEYLPSRSLSTVLSMQGVLTPGEVARIGNQIASALAAAHQAGIVHRDIKPGNVLLADDGTVKITDFGISHAVGDVTVTATGILAGTPAYLAPEVARGGSASFASDVFSLGSTLYTALEGTPPFGLDNNAIAMLHHVASGEITPPRQSGPLTALLLRLLQCNPEQRPTMQQAQEALATLAAGIAAPQGGPSAVPTRPIRNDPPVEPAPAAQQATLVSAPPERTTRPVPPINMNPPADQPPVNGDDRPGTPRFLVGALVILLLAAGALVAVLVSYGSVTSDGDSTAAIPPSASERPEQSPQPPSTQPEPSSPRQVIPPTISAAPTTSAEPTVPADPSISAAPGNPQGTPQQAITDYYALMPRNLTAGWERLTADYQQNHAGGFTGYENFWNPVQRVTVLDVSANQDGAVDATVEYVFKDGRVIEERASYGLVAEDGTWKIGSSTVRSSQAKSGG
jgi:eukaryotic-like serine/threonine-protein kinase